MGRHYVVSMKNDIIDWAIPEIVFLEHKIEYQYLMNELRSR